MTLAVLTIAASARAQGPPLGDHSSHAAAMSLTAVRHGSRHAAAGRWLDARRSFEAAILVDPSSAIAHYNLGVTLVALDCREEALRAYREALRRNPQFVEARINLGVELSKGGQLVEALEALTRAARQAPRLAAAQHNLGVVLGQLGRFDEAVQPLELALGLAPNDGLVRRALAENYFNLAVSLAAFKRIPEALAACRHALRRKPDFPRAQRLLRSLQSAGSRVLYAEALLPAGGAGAHQAPR
jgi:tetratricopeptide (TPR) repeat protein